MRHGVSSYLCLGRLPKGGAYIRRQLSLLKQQLEKDVQDLYGELTTYHSALIQSACRHEGRAQLLTRWMRQVENDAREKDETVAISDRLAIVKEIGSASDARDRCLERIGLGRPSPRLDVWNALTPAGTSTQLVAAGADNGEQDDKEEDDGTNSILNEQDLAEVLDDKSSDTG